MIQSKAGNLRHLRPLFGKNCRKHSHAGSLPRQGITWRSSDVSVTPKTVLPYTTEVLKYAGHKQIYEKALVQVVATILIDLYELATYTNKQGN